MHSQNTRIDDFRAQKHFEGNYQYWKESDNKIKYVFRRTKKYIRKIETCCDIGIGNGFTLIYFNNRDVKTTGVDISPYIINHFQKKFDTLNVNIDLIEADITKSEFGKDQFSLVTCFDVLEHLPDEGLNAAIKNIADSLKPDGILIGTLPLFEQLEDAKVVCPDCGSKFHPNGHHQSFQNFEDIKNMLKPEFELIKFGEVPVLFTRIFLFYGIGNFLFKLARRIILNKKLSTAYFVAILKNT